MYLTAAGKRSRWFKAGGHIIHGCANAMYLPKVIKYNAGDRATADRYAQIADAIGLCGKTRAAKVEALIQFCLDFNREMNIPNCISEYGEGGKKVEAGQGFVTQAEFESKLSEISANALQDACTLSNPRAIGQAQMERMMTAVYFNEEVYF